MKTTNVEKLVQAKLVEVADLTDKDQELINSLSDEEIDAILSAGQKVVAGTRSGDPVAKVAV